MRKILLAIAFFPALAGAWDLTYETVQCSQACGLTPSSPEKVYDNGADERAVLERLSLQCRWRGFSLHGQPNCSRQRYDFSRDEEGYRCQLGDGKTCLVQVTGIGLGTNGRQVGPRTYSKQATSWDEAYRSALAWCETLARETSTYRCDLAGYRLKP
jgi:hypothetical protein